MTVERVTFAGASGHQLVGRLERDEQRAPVAWAVFAHCFTCSKDIKAAVRISRGLAARGIGVLRFDFTGIGESEGEFADSTFSANLDDLVSAAEFVAGAHGAPTLLVGHSLGGSAVLGAAHRIPSVRAVATIGAPSGPHHTTRLLTDARAELERTGEAVVTIAGRPFRITREFLEDLERGSVLEGLATLNRALLVMHAPLDRVVGIDHAAALFQAAKHPKSFISLDDADHLLLRDADAAYAAEVLAAWASRYVTPSRA
jgi:alpha-beta hydrolase superfamily lysophospholipase